MSRASERDATWVWVADQKTILRIDAETNQATALIDLANPPSDIGASAVDKTLWVLIKKQLVQYDETGQWLQTVDLSAWAMDVGEKARIKVDPYDGSLWLADHKRVWKFSNGDRQAAWSAEETIAAMDIDIDETVWVLTKTTLVHLSKEGNVLTTVLLAPPVHEPRYLVVDGLGGIVWVGEEHRLYALDLNHLDRPPSEVVLPSGENDEPEIRTLAVHPVFGTLWLATDRALLFYDRSLTLAKTLDLETLQLEPVDALRFEPVVGGLWVGAKKSVAHFTSNGDFIARIDIAKVSRAMDASAFTLTPTLALQRPDDASLTNNAFSAIGIGLGADCTGTPCSLVDGYYGSFRFDAMLNGISIGSDFAVSGTAAQWTPLQRLPEGLSVFTVQATDLFGHRSNTVNGRFTVDTIPPSFIGVSPADGSTLPDADVHLTGSVDDPNANVTLLDGAGAGIGLAGSTFDFVIQLKSGGNAYTLVARDPAGNESSLNLRLTLQPPAPKFAITNLTPGMTVDGDTVLVAGTFEGPANTGVTVNGVQATVIGNQFYAYVPLQGGTNELVAVASTESGELGRQTLTINSSGPSAVIVKRVDPGNRVRTIAGTGEPGYNGDGIPATQAQLNFPYSIAAAADGSVYVADSENQRVRRISRDGTITTVAGDGTYGYGGDGGPATQAQLMYPIDVALGPDGSLYIADWGAACVRRVMPNGIIQTVAGNGEYGDSADGEPAAQAMIGYPEAVAVAADGTLYISDYYNQKIRRVSPDGILGTAAGTGEAGFSGDGGPGGLAQISYPEDLLIGSDGSLYIADAGNSRIRCIAADGTISTVAGTGEYGNAGDEGPALNAFFEYPEGLAFGLDGSLYVSDWDDSRVRVIAGDGTIHAFAGTGAHDFNSDGLPPLETTFDSIPSIAIDAVGNLVIVDYDNGRIRAVPTVNTQGDYAPLQTSFSVKASGGLQIAKIEVDFDGNGTIDFTTTQPNAVITYLFQQSGAYDVRFYVTTTTGATYQTSSTVIVKDARATDTLLRGIFNGMLDRLRAGDIAGGLNFISAGMRDKYSGIFNALGSNLPAAVNQLGPLKSGVFGEDFAEYVLVRETPNEPHAFLIYFLRGQDGVWRIDGM